MLVVLKALNQLLLKKSVPPKPKVTGHSLMTQFLTDDIWEQLHDKVDKNGMTIYDVISSGFKHPESHVGVYTSGETTYEVFAPLLDKIIEKYHGHKKTDTHDATTGFDLSKVSDLNLDPEGKYVKSSRIRFARNLNDYPFGTKITKEQRLQLEERAIKAFQTFEGDLQGTYSKLPEMKASEKERLRKTGRLYMEANEDEFLVDANLANDWPSARGIFLNKDETFCIWVNEEDHFRIMAMQDGANVRQVFEKLSRAAKHITKTLKFAENKHLGAVGTCPTNCGTGLRASVHVKLSYLGKDKERLNGLAKKLNLQIRGIGGEKDKSDTGVYDISNQRRLGFNEAELVNDMILGVKELITVDKEYEAKQSK